MKTLGVVLAGGASRRFGSDKAEAVLDGRSLLDHAIAALRPHCDLIAVVGREREGLLSLKDRPHPEMGPLGGVAAALRYAADNGFAQVLSISVDCAYLPADIRTVLEPGPSYLESQPVIGLWPADSVSALEQMLAGDGSKAVRAFADRIDARAVTGDFEPPNINTRDDLEQLSDTAPKSPPHEPE